MKQEIMEKYESCIRFDEGSLSQSKEYQEIVAEAERIRTLITEMFGPSILPLLEEYTDAIYEEMELEARHYFEQGYRMRNERREHSRGRVRRAPYNFSDEAAQ